MQVDVATTSRRRCHTQHKMSHWECAAACVPCVWLDIYTEECTLLMVDCVFAWWYVWLLWHFNCCSDSMCFVLFTHLHHPSHVWVCMYVCVCVYSLCRFLTVHTVVIARCCDDNCTSERGKVTSCMTVLSICSSFLAIDYCMSSISVIGIYPYVLHAYIFICCWCAYGVTMQYLMGCDEWVSEWLPPAANSLAHNVMRMRATHLPIVCVCARERTVNVCACADDVDASICVFVSALARLNYHEWKCRCDLLRNDIFIIILYANLMCMHHLDYITQTNFVLIRFVKEVVQGD